MVRTVIGQVDPQMLMAGLWPSPQWSRMLMYSVIIHLCFATSLMIFRALDFSFGSLPAAVYRVDLVEFERPRRKPVEKVVKSVPKKREAPQPKPEPKPEPKLEPKPKPKPKPEPARPKKNKVLPPPEKKVEVPKVVEPPAPEKKPPEVKAEPEPPKKEEPPPPPPEPEPTEVAKAIEPTPEPMAKSTVNLDADFITPELKWYIEIIRRKVWQNWIEPRHALLPGTHARAVIRFEISRDGNFASTPVIFESSNISLLDQSGYRAVVRSAPFPPLPESYSGESLGVRFGFEYGERT
ncbi:MAG: TonB C-terminal domain-containing protein [Candidatus Hydrogenedentota bacterium]|nr:MAG: TonB C-terminal domain-containing protein [Candidatus Hydrogenedentota bacterium]